jgi:hypothetical protein
MTNPIAANLAEVSAMEATDKYAEALSDNLRGKDNDKEVNRLRNEAELAWAAANRAKDPKASK